MQAQDEPQSQSFHERARVHHHFVGGGISLLPSWYSPQAYPRTRVTPPPASPPLHSMKMYLKTVAGGGGDWEVTSDSACLSHHGCGDVRTEAQKVAASTKQTDLMGGLGGSRIWDLFGIPNRKCGGKRSPPSLSISTGASKLPIFALIPGIQRKHEESECQSAALCTHMSFQRHPPKQCLVARHKTVGPHTTSSTECKFQRTILSSASASVFRVARRAPALFVRRPAQVPKSTQHDEEKS